LHFRKSQFSREEACIEATGHFRSGFKYGAGFVNGTGALPDHNQNKDMYLNLFQTFGRGDGQTAGQRIGVFGYYGWQPTLVDTQFVSATGATDISRNKGFYRFGLDGSFNWSPCNLELLWMKGVDDKAFNTASPLENYEYTGWLAKLDVAALPNNRLVASVLYNRVNPPDTDAERQVSAVSGVVRYYLGDWSAVNVSIHAEVTHRTVGKDSQAKDDLFALLLDFAF
jgi:hypothetical protein